MYNLKRNNYTRFCQLLCLKCLHFRYLSEKFDTPAIVTLNVKVTCILYFNYNNKTLGITKYISIST
jgi:hypothetical protein